ncbi:MAG TPA: hypothetical protein PK860_05505 [Paludibacteraceae bacterium]|nr:hypothetical protein [Paludibacteraceae bacterium]HOL00981.1 hypothetical protein [Paludibacteraceae bacterium]HPO67935.1 hypothetical protein [Paludibacteraceae bacterium]
MKGKNILLFVLVILSENLIAQNIETQIYSYSINNSKYSILNLKVENFTNDSLLLWLENDKRVWNLDNKSKLWNYFFKKKGDFSLINIINEYGSTIENINTTIYYTFYKIILPQETFSIIIQFKQNEQILELNIEDKIKKQLVILSDKDIKKAGINFYNFIDLMKMSFKGDQIILNLKDITSTKN